MRAILVRIGIDHAYGNWNAPVDPESCRFVYVPIPEGLKSRFAGGMGRRFREVLPAIDAFATKHGVGDRQSLRWSEMLSDRYMHLDPDFEHLTYGDDGSARGSEIKNLKCGDMLVFYAGLRPIRPGKDRLIYALVGIMVIDEVVVAKNVPRDRRHENAHTRKITPGADDIVVRAKSRVSGRLMQCIDIGEFRDRAYRVRRDVLKAWGGLSVQDGFIQRSARPPRFLDPERFYNWFRRQKPKLLASNFSVNGPATRVTTPSHCPVSKSRSASLPKNGPASKPRVIIVHLRQPRMSDPNETRADPFYEFGSFGCTKCHFKNLMNPKRVDELEGARLAFAQGGPDEFRLVLLTPPVQLIKHGDRCELRWRPVRRPFRFIHAPLLISNSTRSDFDSLAAFLRMGNRRTPCGQFSSAFRSRRTVLEDCVAKEMIEVFEKHVKNSRTSTLARCYSDTMFAPPPKVDTHRRRTYLRLLRKALDRRASCRLSRRC